MRPVWLASFLMVAGCVGVYTVSHSTLDVLMAAAFGLLGYAFMRLEFDRTSFGRQATPSWRLCADCMAMTRG